MGNMFVLEKTVWRFCEDFSGNFFKCECGCSFNISINCMLIADLWKKPNDIKGTDIMLFIHL